MNPIYDVAVVSSTMGNRLAEHVNRAVAIYQEQGLEVEVQYQYGAPNAHGAMVVARKGVNSEV